MRNYTYHLGFAVNGVLLPDPARFGGETSDLDISAERDVTGVLHRDWVAQKVPIELSYINIGWDMCNFILTSVNYPEFQFTFPDPNAGGLRTGRFYVGNRKWTAVWMPDGMKNMDWYTNLTFSVIEY